MSVILPFPQVVFSFDCFHFSHSCFMHDEKEELCKRPNDSGSLEQNTRTFRTRHFKCVQLTLYTHKQNTHSCQRKYLNIQRGLQILSVWPLKMCECLCSVLYHKGTFPRTSFTFVTQFKPIGHKVICVDVWIN